jgi:hypothetical protein
MKTKLTSQSAFFNPRVLLSFAFCSIGVFFALMAFALYPGATALAQGSKQNQSVAPSRGTAPQPNVTGAGQLIISEFRLRGPNGANDEFIELYNTTGANLTATAATGVGLAVAASDGVTRCVVLNGTVIPAGGHFLCVNSVGYSLGTYPAGNGTTATGDATYTTGIPDNAGIALFNNSTGGASFSLANRLDAVGSDSEANTTYKEGTGYAALAQPFPIDYAWVRRLPGGCTSFAECNLADLTTVLGPASVQPQDTGNNINDFIFMDTNGTSDGAGQRLGAPGPQNLSVPSATDGPANSRLLDSCASENVGPNYVRDLTADPPHNSEFGTVDIRRTFTNNLASNITRLRFRIVDITTFPGPSGEADLRPLTSPDVTVTVNRPPCGSGTSSVTVRGTTLEQPPTQPNGGGFNSSMSVNAVTLATPLAAGASIDVRFLLGVQFTGVGRFCVVSETSPPSPAQVSCFTPQDIAPPPTCATTVFSENFEGLVVPALPAGWAASHGVFQAGDPLWVNSTSSPDSPPNGAFSIEAIHALDNRLDTPAIAIKSTSAQVSFRNNFTLENTFDGGVLEVSSPNIAGGAFTDITDAAVGGSFVVGGYNASISGTFGSPIANRKAWSGNAYLSTVAKLGPNVAGQTIKLRFRMGSDTSIAEPNGGWHVDTIVVTDGCAKAVNISTRMQVQTGNNVLIGGFIIAGNVSKQVAIRGIGPSLSQFGIPGVLADPTLELRDGQGGLIKQNDNWQDDPAQAALLTGASLGLGNPLESGIVATLPPNASYTAILAGKNNGTGVGLVEIYDINHSVNSQLANISTRGFVQGGDNVMIGGFILGEDNIESQIAVRGIGPSLAPFGVNPVLANPTLELHDGQGTLLVANDNWQDDPISAAQLSFQGLALSDTNESGIVMSLPLGGFTAVLAGKNGGTGIGLVEIYNLH